MKGGVGFQGALVDGSTVRLLPADVAQKYRRPTDSAASVASDYLVLVEVVDAAPDERGMPVRGDYLWMLEWDLTPTATQKPIPSRVTDVPPTSTPEPSATPSLALATPQRTLLDESFASEPAGWLNEAGGVASYSDGVYEIGTQASGRFVALGTPLLDVLRDVLVSARFRKIGGPPGGGYGIVLQDQGPGSRDGISQSGQYAVIEIGDQGTVGAWRREDDHWVDVLPWEKFTAVRQGNEENDLMVRVNGDLMTFNVNGVQGPSVRFGLSAGRVGVFVGGDGNRVALERYVVQV